MHKKILIATVCFFISLTLFAQTKTLQGKWLTIDGNDSVVLELTKEGVFYLESTGEGIIMGGLNAYSPEETFDDDSVFLDYKYTYDATVVPHRLELTAYYANTDSFVFIMPLVFEFREDKSLAAVFHDEGIYSEDGDMPQPLLKEFYTTTKVDAAEFDVVIFKSIK